MTDRGPVLIEELFGFAQHHHVGGDHIVTRIAAHLTRVANNNWKKLEHSRA
jgi:hypothetical protein